MEITKQHETEVINSAGKKYSYSFEDISYTCGFMYKFLVNPLMKIMPRRITPNTISFLSGLCSLTGFLIILQSYYFNTYKFWWAIPIFILTYIVLDYCDGEQARKTKMCSPIGEFLDHILDSCLPLYLIGGLMIIYNIDQPFYVGSLLTIAYLTQNAVFWERYKNGRMFFTKFSSTESILCLTALITASGAEPVRFFLSTPVFQPDVKYLTSFAEITPLNIFFFVISICAIVNTIQTLMRTNGASFKYYLNIALMFLTSIMLCFSNFPLPFKVIIIGLCNINYNVSLLKAITLKTKDDWPELLMPIFILVGSFWPKYYNEKFIGLFAYICIMIAIHIIDLVFIRLKSWQKADERKQKA